MGLPKRLWRRLTANSMPVSYTHLCLTEITWKETYPIYDFISDPIKKKEIKAAVMRHIEASSL